MDIKVSCYEVVLKSGERVPLIHRTLDDRLLVGVPPNTCLVPLSSVKSIRSAGCRNCDMSWG